MEQNLQVIAKKFRKMISVALFMLRKGISKSKLIADLNMMMKRGKIAGKAIHNLMFHHSHNWAASSAVIHHPCHLNEYEFSCSNSPAYPAFHLPFNLKKSKKNHHRNHQYVPPMEDELMTANAIVKALEILQSEAASPALPGFGRSPMVRQLRVTDSPFPLRNVDEDSHVDEAAEQFINNFYINLRRQNAQL